MIVESVPTGGFGPRPRPGRRYAAGACGPSASSLGTPAGVNSWTGVPSKGQSGPPDGWGDRVFADEPAKDALEELSRSLGEEIYVLAPDDSRYFLGEAVLVGVAGTLVAAFLRGLTARAEDRLEAWGRQCGDWLAERVGEVVRSHRADAGESELQQATLAVASVKAEAGAEVELALRGVFQEQGMTLTEAKDTASRVAAAADAWLAARDVRSR